MKKVFSRVALSCLLAVLALGMPRFNSAAQESAGRSPASRPLTGSGPYKSVMEMDTGVPGHTIYRPDDLSALAGALLPIVVWGNGACANMGNAFASFLTEISSYGYLVIALGPIGQTNADGPPQGPPILPPGSQVSDSAGSPPNLPPAATHPVQLVEAMNWAIAENQRVDSKYYRRLDGTKIAVMGQSCGGVQALEVAADPRITTAVIWNSGLFRKPTDMGGGKAMSKDDLKLLHAPVAYISGDAQDVAFVNANDDFDHITSIPVFRAYERGVTHGGTYREPNGGEFGGVAVAWLDWQLKGNQPASLMFKGTNCGLCVNPRWVVQKKRID
jgi:hypothetical protein